jgi:hypothetical protein
MKKEFQSDENCIVIAGRLNKKAIKTADKEIKKSEFVKMLIR